MLHMCVHMHSCFIENHPIRILEDGLLISEVVLSQLSTVETFNRNWVMFPSHIEHMTISLLLC
jgi:hypothetical protein